MTIEEIKNMFSDTQLNELLVKAEAYEYEQKRDYAIRWLEKLRAEIINASFEGEIATIDRYRVEEIINKNINELRGITNGT